MTPKFDHLSIGKRDADCYDVYFKPGHGDKRPGGRVAALRSEYTQDAQGVRTAIPGTWGIRWEHHKDDGSYDRDFPKEIEALRFGSVHEAFAFYVGQVLL